MFKRRRGVALKLVGLLLVAWLCGVIYLAISFFSRSSIDQVAESQFSVRENRGAAGFQHTVFPPGLERLDGNFHRSEHASESDKQLQLQFVEGQKRLNDLLGGLSNSVSSPALVNSQKYGDLDQFDPQTRSLIQQGLIVPKWNINDETPENDDAPGWFSI
jgi:hypothetical protein